MIEGFIAAGLICTIAFGSFLLYKLNMDKDRSDNLLKIEYALIVMIVMLYSYFMLNELTNEKLMSGGEEEGLEE